MMQSQVLLPSWPFDDDATAMDIAVNDPFELYGLPMDADLGLEFSSSFITTEDSSEISSSPTFDSMFPGENFPYSVCDDQLQITLPLEDFPVLDLEGFEPSTLDDEIEFFRWCLDESDKSSIPSEQSSPQVDTWSPSIATVEIASSDSSLTILGDGIQIDEQQSIFHLLKAYGEALEMKQKELAEVILRCLSEKASPVGETWERIVFHLSTIIQNQGDYLTQESCRNFAPAVRAFYQMFPYGRFAHFAANSAILEAMPENADALHIVDFDIGEGVQWPPLIEAMAMQHKMLRLTSIRWREEELGCSPWRFEETRRQLLAHARPFGLELRVEEMGIDDLMAELKKKGGCREWVAFNCMVGLPHMGFGKSRRFAEEFLSVASGVLLANSNNNVAGNRGIVTFGDGDACRKLKDCWGLGSFGAFFDRYLVHCQAILESMESSFPNHLLEARMAMECLFVAPNISAHSLFQKWKDIRESCHLQERMKLEGFKVSEEMLLEAKEMVKGRESLYGVSGGGECRNEIVLDWKGTPLVRVSVWRNQC